MTRNAPPRLHSLILMRSRGQWCHEVIVTIHSSQFVTISIDSQYSVETVCPGTAGLVCQPVTLTKGKSLLWLVAPVAGLASPGCTPGQNRFCSVAIWRWG